MGNLTFYPDTHIYDVDGIQIPSVTELCNIYGDDIDDIFIENAIEIAADRGVTCHKVLELLLSGVDIQYIEYPDIYTEYVDSIQLFLTENNIEPISIETPIYSPEIMVAGTPDLLCYFNSVLTVIDSKFVAQVCKPKVKSQLNGYDKIYQANNVHAEQLLCVQFLKGKPRLYKVTQDSTEFDIALQVHQIKNKTYSRGCID